MSILPARQGRGPVAPVPAAEMHPEAERFLNIHANIVDERNALRAQVTQLRNDLEVEQRVNESLRDQLERQTRRADELQDGFHEARAQVAVIASTSIAALESIKSAQARAHKNGALPDNQIADERTEEMGRRFASPAFTTADKCVNCGQNFRMHDAVTADASGALAHALCYRSVGNGGGSGSGGLAGGGTDA